MNTSTTLGTITDGNLIKNETLTISTSTTAAQCQPLQDKPYCLSGLYCPFLNVTDSTTIPSKCPPVIECEL